MTVAEGPGRMVHMTNADPSWMKIAKRKNSQ